MVTIRCQFNQSKNEFNPEIDPTFDFILTFSGTLYKYDVHVAL